MIWLLACSEYGVRQGPDVPVAEPPGAAEDDFGDPPDWGDCTAGFDGLYSNLAVEVEDAEVGDPLTQDWWDAPAFARFDPNLEFGSGWWPVDEGLAGDPAYFAAEWTAWLRVWEDGEHPFVVGAKDDLWVWVNGELVVELPGPQDYAPQEITLPLEVGQYPLRVRFAQRSSEGSGLRFRPLSEDLSICLPE